MAVSLKAMAGGLLFTASLSLLGWGAEGQGNGRDKKEVSGGATIYLGQDRRTWTPLIHTTVNLTDITSIKSSFQLRTFDPEGTIFYGDSKNGEDWFVLSLKDGIPLMQMSKEHMRVSVAGGNKINDGRWHLLEVSNHGKFVILEVDGASGLVVGMQSKNKEEDLSGELRLALGGVLMDKEEMIVQFNPHLDGCVREGNWLNLSNPWETEADELWPCYQNVRPGSFFPGTGFAIFNTSVFPVEADRPVKAELWGNFSEMDGTILSIKAAGHEPTFAVVANNTTERVTIAFGEDKVNLGSTLKRLLLTFDNELLRLTEDGSTNVLVRLQNTQAFSNLWRGGRLAIGGLLGEGEDDVGSRFLTGCLEKIQIQGKDLDQDLSDRHMSITSHSCPA